MSTAEKNSVSRKVLFAYGVYLMGFVAFAESLFVTNVHLFSFLLSFHLLCISMAFGFAYMYKERIRAAPWRYVFAFGIIFLAVMALLRVSAGNEVFPFAVLVSPLFASVAFAYTYFLKEKIMKSPWKFLFAFVVLFLLLLLPLMGLPALPYRRSFPHASKNVMPTARCVNATDNSSRNHYRSVEVP